MSPGPTFERVYLELKRQLREGSRPPGTPLEPSAIGDELGSSFTPVRDALHRLVGEGLVDTPRHNGFAVPLPTEQALRDLYAWNGEVVALLISQARSAPTIPVTTAPTTDVEIAIADYFLAIAEASPNREHGRVVTQLNARLAPYRRIEAAVLTGTEEEFRALREHPIDTGHGLARMLSRYHKRRIGAVPQILAAMTVG